MSASSTIEVGVDQNTGGERSSHDVYAVMIESNLAISVPEFNVLMNDELLTLDLDAGMVVVVLDFRLDVACGTQCDLPA